MRTGIGATLREARNRRKIELAEVEATIKIRARYLQAMENEEWELLPGGVYTRSFIRTYATHLGLDGERLADEYRSEAALPGEQPQAAVQAVAGAGRRIAVRRLAGPAGAAIVSLGLVAAAIAIVLLSGGDDGGTEDAASKRAAGIDRGGDGATGAFARAEAGIVIQLTATGEIWVCLRDADHQPLVNGEILMAGAEEGPFRSDSFTVSFGNGEVAMQIDGKTADIPATSSPIGYEIGSGGALQPLAEAERPTCT